MCIRDRETAMRVEYAMHHLFPELQELNFSALLDRVIFTLMNTEMNREILEGVPSREFMDLSVVYRFFLENNGMTGTILISNDMMRELDLTEEKLYVMARENTMKLMPVLMIPFERFEKIVSARQFKRNPQVLVEAEKESSRDDLGAYILTNHMGMNGAVGMLYESRLFQLAEKIGSNFFILPSTLHQVMAISEESADWDAMKEMPSIPGEERLIRPEEMLSKKIYYYDRFTRKLRFSTEEMCIRDRNIDSLEAGPLWLSSCWMK